MKRHIKVMYAQWFVALVANQVFYHPFFNVWWQVAAFVFGLWSLAYAVWAIKRETKTTRESSTPWIIVERQLPLHGQVIVFKLSTGKMHVGKFDVSAFRSLTINSGYYGSFMTELGTPGTFVYLAQGWPISIENDDLEQVVAWQPITNLERSYQV